ncbi:Transcriptional adapter ada2 [Puccinia graminis f. sp. tritici]|uniref:Transcriptional adapter ada2 n=2 Tax=Puccinia graminis f. sp. tritici TaxID=56615 RepID=A0A5B0PYD0_PUCGR|nr:Transcriptional adapter ada2 [Puccinia graminis f. sp. tritici]
MLDGGLLASSRARRSRSLKTPKPTQDPMTATKRKTTKNQPNEPSTKPAGTSGVKYHCDGCSADISNTVRIRCAHRQNVTTNLGAQILTQSALVCDNFDLCGQCFCEGKEIGQHKAWHDYRVIEPHSVPIFTEDWGADEELLLIEACQIYGLGNWSDIADHVGNGRTKEEVERHYLDVFIGSDDYPLPPIDARIDIDQDEFQARKKRRLEEVHARPLQMPPPKPVSSAPTNHEIAGFMPGRLDFEIEWENEAENAIKDMSFGRVYRFGGDSQPEKLPEEEDDSGEQKEDNDAAPDQNEETASSDSAAKRKRGVGSGAGKTTQRTDEPAARVDGNQGASVDENCGDGTEADGRDSMTSSSVDPLQTGPSPKPKANSKVKEKEEQKADDEEDDEEVDEEPPLSDEPDLDLELKLTILDIYNDKYDRRLQAKAVVFDRNLLEYKKIQAAERKMPKEIRDLVVRIKPFARLQTATDHEKFQEGLLYEMALRKRVAELQEYRKMGITTLADAERYEKEKAARLFGKQREMTGHDRFGVRKPRVGGAGLSFDEATLSSREGTPGSSGKGCKQKSAVPLSLSTSSSRQLLHPSELALCSRLRILPKPFLTIKETLFREHVRRVALGQALQRADVTKLFPPLGLVDEDLLEVEEGSSGGLEETLIGAGNSLTLDHNPSLNKDHKVEIIWDFYFSAGSSIAGNAIDQNKPNDHPNLSLNPISS